MPTIMKSHKKPSSSTAAASPLPDAKLPPPTHGAGSAPSSTYSQYKAKASSLSRTDLIKGKGKMPATDVPHASTCTMCAHHATSTSMVDGKAPSNTISPDCVLYDNPAAFISAKTVCVCTDEQTPEIKQVYSILHRLFIDRLKMHDLPITFYEEVMEQERTVVPEMLRDALVCLPSFDPSGSIWTAQGVAGHSVRRSGNSGRKEKLHYTRLFEWPDFESRIELREGLVSLARTLGKELLFDSTSPVIFEELSYLADTHGYDSITHGPPCACILSSCLPCLHLLVSRLVPTTPPPPPSRPPADFAFLNYSAKALRVQGVLNNWVEGQWEEPLKQAQLRTGDELWRICMEIDLGRLLREYFGGLEEVDDECFYKAIVPLFESDYDHDGTYRPQRDLEKINQCLCDISAGIPYDIETRRQRAEKEKLKGNNAFGKGLYKRALKHFSAAIELDPGHQVYPLNRSAALLKLNRFQRAETDSSTSINLSPRNSKALFRRAMARKGLGALIDAEADLKLVIALEPQNPAVQTELNEILDVLSKMAGSSSAISYASRIQLPPVVDSTEAQTYRRDSEAYWESRYASSCGPEASSHRGTSGYPCRKFNRDFCDLGFACPDSHAPDAYSVRGASGQNLCLKHMWGGGCDKMEEEDMDDDDYDEDELCPYSHAAPGVPTEDAMKAMQASFERAGSGKDSMRMALEASILNSMVAPNSDDPAHNAIPFGSLLGMSPAQLKQTAKSMPTREGLMKIYEKLGMPADLARM